MKRYQSLLFAILVILFVRILFTASFFKSLEYKAQDTLFRMRDTLSLSDSIVIVALDDETFNATKKQWPFPREDHAKLIENLNLAGAKQIVFDVEFTENSDKESDRLLAEAAAKWGNVIFAGKINRDAENPDHIQVLKPIKPILDRGCAWGIVNMPYDPDNSVRNYSTYDKVYDAYYFPLGVASIANTRLYSPTWGDKLQPKHGKLKIADKIIHLNQRNHTLINYHGPARTFPYVSYSSVVDDSATAMPGYEGVEMDEYYQYRDSGYFKDKIVLVGMTIDEAHDKFATPYGGELMPGVEIHANFIEMVLRNDYLKSLSPIAYIIIELALILGLWFLFKAFKPQFSAIFMLLIIVAQYFLAYFLFKSTSLLIPIAQTAIAILIIYIVALVSHYIETQKEKRFIRNAFQQYMAPELVKQLLESPDNLKYGGSLQEITVLFSDIRSFTTYSENHRPEETVQILKEYLTEMVNVIKANNGIVDKFVGDEIMALYGTPIKLENHALAACKTALEMRERLTVLQERWIHEGRESFDIGIGVNTGTAVIGNLGSEQIFDFTAIGDTVNLGARLESINKEYDTAKHIIISEFTLAKVENMVDSRYIDEVKVKGKNKSVKIYELIGIKPGF